MRLPNPIRALTVATAVLAVIGASSASAQTCAMAEDETALQVRVLQTELMVAALSCQQQDPYNAFVTRFQPSLAAQGKALKGYFKRVYGGGSTAQLDEFVTRLANEASLRVMRNLAGYCTESKALFRSVITLEANGLELFVTSWTNRDAHGVLPCVQQAANP